MMSIIVMWEFKAKTFDREVTLRKENSKNYKVVD